MNSTYVRRGGLLLAALLIPACSSGKKVSPSLFDEGFNGAFPGTAWTAPLLTGTATAQVDGANGFPAPSLKMTTTAATASATSDTVMAFSNPSLTLSVHLADLSGSTTELGSGSVSILDATPAVVASATWNNATGMITFHINGGAADASVAAVSDGTFHRLVFNVNSAGTWSFDNGAAAVTQPGFPAGLLKIRLGASFGAGTAWPSFFFDNVSASSP
jgi:hypothetical protein